MQQTYSPDLLKGKTALITGGGTGIGFAIATELGRAGAKLVIASRKKEHLEPAKEKLIAEGFECEAIIVNIRDEENVGRLTNETVEHFGSLDILINNAGGQFVSPAAQITPKGWRSVIDTNLNGTWLMTQAAAKAWMLEHGGKIVNITLNMWNGFPGTAHTSAARAAVVNLTKTLAVEWAQFDIGVNGIAPGTTDTSGLDQYGPGTRERMRKTIPMRRLGLPEECAALAVFLASPASNYITGETVTIDGGQYLYNGNWPIPDRKKM